MNLSVKDVPHFIWAALLVLALLSSLPLTLSSGPGHSFGGVLQTVWINSGSDPKLDYDVREVQSPLLFAFPSTAGYSAEIDSSTTRTELRFAKTVQREYFLDTGYAAEPGDLLVVLSDFVEQGIPFIEEPAYALRWVSHEDQSVVLSDNLQRRWVTSSFDSPEEIEGSFFVRAQIEVSEHGRVKHLFVESPIENRVWNQAVVRALYAMQFEAGSRESGWVEARSRSAKEIP
ncbi:MAG: energy transducer TonB [Pontiellaceae bacterium]